MDMNWNTFLLLFCFNVILHMLLFRMNEKMIVFGIEYDTMRMDNGDVMSNMANVEAIGWESIRAYGQTMSADVLLDVDHRWAMWFAGAAPAKRGQDPFGKDAITITFAPDLDVQDEAVQHVLRLSLLEEVECLVPPELAPQLSTELGGLSWQIEKDGDQVVAMWKTKKNTVSHHLLNWASNVSPEMLTTHFSEQLGSDLPNAISYFRALQVHHSFPLRSLFITRSRSVLRGRYDGWPHEIGQCTPEEALVLVGVFLRQRNIFVDILSPSLKRIPHRYNWYCGAAQVLFSRYLDVFADISNGAEKRDAVQDRALLYIEGILTRFKSLLRAHDQLGELHFRALRSGATNDINEDQGDTFYAAAQSAAGILEGIAVLIAELEGNVQAHEKRNVGFPALVAGTRPWVRNLQRYRPVAECAVRSRTPLLTLITGQRLQGFHYYPVMGSSGEFGETVPLLVNGREEVRILKRLSLPLIRLPEPPDDMSWITSGVDGLLLIGGRLYIFPWLALRSAIRDLVHLVENTLEALCTVQGETSTHRETVFLSLQGRDLVRRVLDFHVSLHDQDVFDH